MSQRRLALRAGTSQDAVSRIERGEEAPSYERFRELLLVMGARPQLGVVPLEDVLAEEGLAAARELTAEERLRESCSWNLVATTLETAGAEAREAAHPATIRREP